jgi:hypothetical protein
VVKKRLTEPTQPTAQDLTMRTAERTAGAAGVWFVRYRDRKGQWCKGRTTAKQIRERIGAGRMPAHVEASALAQGPFRPLQEIAEFHDAWKAAPASPPDDEKIGPEDLPRPLLSPGVRWLMIGGGLCGAALLGLLARLILFP